MVEDPHPEALRPSRQRLADPPEADDPERRAVDVGAEQQQRTPRLPVAVADVAVALGEPSGGGHQQRPGEVGGRLGQDARRVPDGDAARGAGRDIDVVEADGVVADDAKARPGRVEERVVDPVGEQGQDAVAAGDRAAAARRAAAGGRPPRGPSSQAAATGVEPLVRDASGDEDAGSLAHTRAATSGSTTVRIRASASVRFSCELAYEIRMWSSPCCPNADPASTQTPASWSSRSASSAPDKPGPGDVREDVERAARPAAFDAGDRVEAVDDQVAPRPELDDHRVDVVLLPDQRLDRADLGERRDAADRVDDQLAVGLDQRLGHDRVAHPPAGHRERLGEPVEDDRPLGHPGQRGDRDVLGAVVQDPPVDLVGEDPQVVLDGELGDRVRGRPG